jgi:hypothetical protein
LSPKLRKLVGSVQLPADFDEEKELRSALEKKTPFMIKVFLDTNIIIDIV